MASIGDLNTHLFAQLDRMSGEMTPEQIEHEAKRAEAIVSVADQITRNSETCLKAAKLYAEYGQSVLPHLPMIAKSEKAE